MLRTFIAVKINPTPALCAFLTRLAKLEGGLKPVAPDKLHVTLKFLGDTDEKLLTEIKAVLQNAVVQQPACEAKLVGVGAFPSTHRPSVLWVGLDDGGALARIAGTLDKNLKSLGFPREQRPFQPHLTLLRLRSRPPEALFSLMTELAIVDFGTTRIESVELFESTLLPSGAKYTVLESVRLA